jgi:hypothetical protein
MEVLDNPTDEDRVAFRQSLRGFLARQWPVAEAVAMQRISSEERAKLKKQQLDPRCIHPRKQVGHKD